MPMPKLIYETSEAIFQFDLPSAIETIDQYATEHNVKEAAQLIDFIAESSDDSITIPIEYDYFSYVVLNLLSNNQGSATCKTCKKTYPSDQLKPTIVGHGKSPLSVNLEKKGGIKKLFGKKQKRPGLLGGRGYDCPQGHNVISMITWRT